MVVVTAIPGFLSFARFCGGLTCFILSVPSHRWETLISHVVFKGALTATYATELFTDVTISVIFIFCLLRRRSSAMHFKRTNDIVEKLVYYVINTAIANIICSIAVIVTLHAAEGSLAFIGIIEMRCKLYANVMMALLNARTVIFKNRDIELTALGGRNRVPKTQVHIYTDTIVHRTQASNVTDHNSGDSENQGLEILDVKGAQHIIS
ncbi:hypothetical protein BC629DRAFT_1167066 [Irpex lacteus]|nr:hypothetical protein BC629DRAFT_1167066 [Irpex lacteus]